MLASFLVGASYFFNAISLLWHPTLGRFVLLPLLINILFFIFLFALMVHYYVNIDLFVMTHLPSWLSVMSLFVKIIVLLIYIITVLYSFFTVATIIAAPFNGLLAEKVVVMYGEKLIDKSWLMLLADTPRLIGRQLLILLLYVPTSLLLSVLLLVPILHAVILPVWVWFHARFMALIYLDYPTDNAGVSLNVLRIFMHSHKALVFGFGSTVLFFSTIPILNFLVIPVSVIGATMMWSEHGRRFVNQTRVSC